MLDRFVKYLEYKGETMYSAELHINVPKGTIYRAYRVGSNISSAVLEKIANAYPDLDVAWLVTGKGEMHTSRPPLPNDVGIIQKVSFEKTINAILLEKKISLRQLEVQLGLSNGTLRKAKARGSDIKSNLIQKLITLFPDINEHALILGRHDILFPQDETLVHESIPPEHLVKLTRSQLIEFLKSPHVRDENYGLAADSFFILYRSQQPEEEPTSDNLFERTVSRWLKDRGLNKARLAELMGVSRQSVSSVFKGKPHKDTVMKIGTTLAIPKAEIDSLIGEMNYTESREITQRVPSNGFSSLVRAVLKDKKISQADLARRMGKSQPNISMVLKKDRPSHNTVQEFAKALGVDPNELV